MFLFCRLAPGAPTAVTTNILTPTSWAPTWTDGSAGDPQETYSLKCVASGSLCTATAVGTVPDGLYRGDGAAYSGAPVSELTPGVDYDCFVLAINSVEQVCSTAVPITTP